MHPRGTHEDGNEEDDPPEKGDHQEENFEPSESPDAPEIVGADLQGISSNVAWS